jgi:hypothetical protein
LKCPKQALLTRKPRTQQEQLSAIQVLAEANLATAAVLSTTTPRPDAPAAVCGQGHVLSVPASGAQQQQQPGGSGPAVQLPAPAPDPSDMLTQAQVLIAMVNVSQQKPEALLTLPFVIRLRDAALALATSVVRAGAVPPAAATPAPQPDIAGQSSYRRPAGFDHAAQPLPGAAAGMPSPVVRAAGDELEAAVRPAAEPADLPQTGGTAGSSEAPVGMAVYSMPSCPLPLGLAHPPAAHSLLAQPAPPYAVPAAAVNLPGDQQLQDDMKAAILGCTTVTEVRTT